MNKIIKEREEIFPPRLIKVFGREGLKNLVEYVSKKGQENLTKAQENPAYYWGIWAARQDVIHRLLTTKTFASEDRDQEIMSRAQEDEFYEHVQKRHFLDAAEYTAYFQIRTGKILGSRKEQELIAKAIEDEYQYAFQAIEITPSGYARLGHYAAYYRIITRKLCNFFVGKKEMIRKILVKKIKMCINTQPYLVLDDIAAYCILYLRD